MLSFSSFFTWMALAICWLVWLNYEIQLWAIYDGRHTFSNLIISNYCWSPTSHFVEVKWCLLCHENSIAKHWVDGLVMCIFICCFFLLSTSNIIPFQLLSIWYSIWLLHSKPIKHVLYIHYVLVKTNLMLLLRTFHVQLYEDWRVYKWYSIYVVYMSCLSGEQNN